MKVAIEVRDLHVWIGRKHVLKGINLEVPKKTITAVLGPSGSGKSTLLRCINRLIDLVPNAKVRGETRVLGIDVYRSDPYRIRKIVGTVLQQPTPFPHMSIYDNVAIAARISGVARSKRELDKVVRWALEKAMLWEEVKDRLHEPPTCLSGGQKQRLCLARTLATKPKILLLDEPTANIDPHNTIKIEEAIKELVKELELTVVIVTHMPQQALRLAQQAAVLNSGKLVAYGPTNEVVSKWIDKYY